MRPTRIRRGRREPRWGAIADLALGSDFASNILDTAIRSQFTYDNYVVLSFGNLGETEGVTVGIASQVLTARQIERWFDGDAAVADRKERPLIPDVDPNDFRTQASGPYIKDEFRRE